MPLRNGLSEELNRQGNEHFGRGHYTEAYACYAKALECDRVTGDRRALAATLGNMGNICAVSGRREAAQNYYQEVLELQKSSATKKGSARPWGISVICAQTPVSGTGRGRTIWKRSIS